MPSCKSCHSKWSWKQTIKKTFTAFRGMTCPNCGEKQYLTARTRRVNTAIPLIIVPLMMLGNLYSSPSYFALFALLGLIPLVFIIYPFYVELSNEEESLF